MKRKISWPSVIAALLIVACAVALLYFNADTLLGEPIPGEFSMHVIDVGQGDSILIACEGEYMLVDAGERDRGDNVVSYLRRHGVDALRYLVATHPHSDHIGGMASVLGAFSVETFLMPEATHTTATFEGMLDAVAANGCEARYAYTGQQFTLGGAQIDVIWPGEGAFSGDDLNNCSVVLYITYQGYSFLLTGDAEKDAEKAFTPLLLGRVDVLKVGHHGSSTSSGSELLGAGLPYLAIVSCGADNSYGHPHEQVLEAYEEISCDVYRTDLSGTITIYIDESGDLYVQRER